MVDPHELMTRVVVIWVALVAYIACKIDLSNQVSLSEMRTEKQKITRDKHYS